MFEEFGFKSLLNFLAVQMKSTFSAFWLVNMDVVSKVLPLRRRIVKNLLKLFYLFYSPVSLFHTVYIQTFFSSLSRYLSLFLYRYETAGVAAAPYGGGYGPVRVFFFFTCLFSYIAVVVVVVFRFS